MQHSAYATLNIAMITHYAECNYDQCHGLFIIVPNIIMLSVVVLIVVAPCNILCRMYRPRVRLLGFLWLKRLARVKHSSLFSSSINNEEECFEALTPGADLINIFCLLLTVVTK